MDDTPNKSLGVWLMVGLMTLFFSTFLVIEIVQAVTNGYGGGWGDTKVLSNEDGRSFYKDGPRHTQCCPANRHP